MRVPTVVPLMTVLLTISSVGASPNVIVTLNGPAGAVSGGYVALVTDDEPWQRPTAEALTDVAGSASLQAPPGAYELIAVASGLESTSEKVTLSDGKQTAVTVSMLPGMDASGHIEDPDGRPILHARVSTVRAAVQPPIGTFSELAWNSVARAETTTTDGNGWFRLPVPAAKKMAMLIEARGYAPAWRTTSPEEDPSAMKITLRRGASLRVELDRIEPAAMIVVRSIASSAPEVGVPPDWQERVWARRASDRVLTWGALPGGEYKVTATFPDPARFASAVELARVSLAAGAAPLVPVVLPPTPPRATVYSTFRVPRAADITALRAFVKHANTVKSARQSSEPLPNGNLIYVEGAASPEDVYFTTADDLVLPRLPVVKRSASLASHPAGAVSLKVTVPAEEAMPSIGTADFRQCANEVRAVLPVGVARDGAIEMPWPAPCDAVSLRFGSFAPLAVTARVARGSKRALGEFQLQAPAEAEIRVTHDPNGTPARHAIVRASVARDPIVQVTIAEQVAGDDGLLLLKALPAGEEITFEAVDAATMMTGRTRARLRHGEESPAPVGITIPQPAALVVAPTLDPDAVAHVPNAAIRGVSLRRLDQNDEMRRSRDVSPGTPEVEFEQLPPGTWQPWIVVDTGGATDLIELDPVVLASGDRRRLTPRVKPAVFEGRLLSRGRGVQGQLTIVDQRSRRAYGRTAKTNDEGRFRIALPAPGFYEVHLARAVDGAFDLVALGEHHFADPKRPVEIELPAGGLDLLVLDEEMKAVAGAEVKALLRSERRGGGVRQIERSARTDTSGKASLTEVAEGLWIVQATDGSGRRAEKSVQVTDSSTATPAVLTLERNAAVIEGVVRETSGGTAPGAEMHCFFVGDDGLPREQSAKADEQGRFRIVVSQPAPNVFHCSAVTAEGGVLPFAGAVGRTLDVAPPPVTGRLVIDDPAFDWRANALWLVSQDGRLVNVAWTVKFRGPDGSLIVPRLSTGSWRMVRVQTLAALLTLGRAGGGALPEAAAFSLDPGETEHIRLQPKSAGEPAETRNAGKP